MDSRLNNSLSASSHSDTSTISLDVCDSTPLSPGKPLSFDPTATSASATTTTTGAAARPTEGKVCILNRRVSRECKMEDIDSPTKRVKDGSWQWKISIIAAFILFSVIVLVAVSYSMRSMQCKDEEADKDNILRMYKSFFMSKEDADKMLNDMNEHESDGKAAAVRDFPSLPRYNCTLAKPGLKQPLADLPLQIPTAGETLYHGCCVTTRSMTSYDQLPTMAGELLTLVQFGDMKQYFYIESCFHDMQCTDPCVCERRPSHVMAVVVDDSLTNVRLEWVMYLGTCKCINQETR